MKKKWTKSNGFTLAELLIVVAIIAVLVAISIPIFTSQLEKAREATDLSDVRSAYAEVMMAAISDDTTATYSKDPNQTIHKSNGLYSVTVSPLHQEQDNWQGNMDLNVGGVSSKDTTHWIGTPKATGSCEVSYNPQGDSVVLNWSGKSTGGGNTGGGGAVTPGGSTTGGGSTPAPNPGTGGGTSGGTTGGGSTPVPNPGTGGGTSGGTAGGDNNQGNTGGNTGGSTGGNTSGSDQGNNNSGDTGDSTKTEFTYDNLRKSADTYPTASRWYDKGKLYLYEDVIYVSIISSTWQYDPVYNNLGTPTGNYSHSFIELKPSAFEKIYTAIDANSYGNFENNLKNGCLFTDGKDYYIFTGPDGWGTLPSISQNNWVKIIFDLSNYNKS